jgi:predicted  nucleic acid-binding Zn-ribbon protein
MLPHPGADINAIPEPMENLKSKINELTTTCAKLEKEIQSLKFGHSSHERYLESYRQELVAFINSHGALNTDFQGRNFDLQ